MRKILTGASWNVIWRTTNENDGIWMASTCLHCLPLWSKTRFAKNEEIGSGACALVSTRVGAFPPISNSLLGLQSIRAHDMAWWLPEVIFRLRFFCWCRFQGQVVGFLILNWKQIGLEENKHQDRTNFSQKIRLK